MHTRLAHDGSTEIFPWETLPEQPTEKELNALAFAGKLRVTEGGLVLPNFTLPKPLTRSNFAALVAATEAAFQVAERVPTDRRSTDHRLYYPETWDEGGYEEAPAPATPA